jgi:N,N'-diacetyllegionaminate synthase
MDLSRVFVIAEAGVNHNGSLDLALKLVDAAKAAGADAVKFQTFRTEKIVTRAADMADYQKTNVGTSEGQFEMLKRLELGPAEFLKIQRHCEDVGLLFLSTPDETVSLDFLVDELAMPIIKIGSAEVTNLPFLAAIARKQRPMILSTGMSTLGEVEAAINAIRSINQHSLSVLQCTSSYPCPFDDVNLLALRTLEAAFRLPVGYSDHTLGVEIAIAAVSLGARIIEKHITLDTQLPGPDHAASLPPDQFATMVRFIRNVERAFGTGIKQPTSAERKTLQIVRKRLVASRPLAVAKQLDWPDLEFKRSSSGIFVEHANFVIGKRLLRAVQIDEPIEWRHLMDCEDT